MLPASAKPGGAPQSRTPFSITSWVGSPTYNVRKQTATGWVPGPMGFLFPLLPKSTLRWCLRQEWVLSEDKEVLSEWKHNVRFPKGSNSRFSPRPPRLKGNRVSISGILTRRSYEPTSREENTVGCN